MMGEKTNGMPEGIKSAMFWAIGIGVIALILVILLIIFGNLSGNLGFDKEADSFSNETINMTDAGVTPAGAVGKANGVISNVVMTNETDGVVVTAGNYTIDGILIKNLTSEFSPYKTNVTYTVSYDSQGELDAEDVILNYSLSATNISAQFPTVGTIVGIALLLVVLIGLLVFAISKMMGVAENPTGGSNSSFG